MDVLGLLWYVFSFFYFSFVEVYSLRFPFFGWGNWDERERGEG